MIDKKNHILTQNGTIKEALLLLNEAEGGTLFILDEHETVLGTVTDGDIRRGLLDNITLDMPVAKVMRTEFRSIKSKDYSLETINEFKNQKIRMIPVMDENGCLVKLLDLHALRSVLPVEVLLMAGGRGERLRPMTDEIPKPLLIVGNKPIIEHNIDRLALYGVEKISISVKYKAEMIENYFGNGAEKGLQISYLHEDEPLGTLGAISFMPAIETDTVLVMNSDLLTNIDFADFFTFFSEQNAEMAVASIPYRVEIPYGVLETDGDHITSLKEKPTYTYYSNAGIYLIKKAMLDRVPKGEFYNATDLMDRLMNDGNKVVNYPIVHYWLDIGKPEDFKKAQEDIKHIRF